MDWKKLGKALLFPHLAILLILGPVSLALLIFSLVYFDETSIISIISYVFAFYMLMVLCFRIPRIIEFFKKLKNDNKYIKRYFSDVNLRINISLYGSLVWNVAFAIFQLGLGFYHGSFWFYSMAAYYVMLAVMRFFLLKHTRHYKADEEVQMQIKKSTICAWLLLAMNLALALIIFFIVYWNRTFNHHMITTIALAAYTFFTFSFAIVNLVKYKKYKSPVYSTAKIITLIAASVSMLTLETTMLTTFGTNEGPLFNQLMLSLTGAAVIVFAITMAIIMLVKNRRLLKELKAGNLEVKEYEMLETKNEETSVN